jgi:hypothetical protein
VEWDLLSFHMYKFMLTDYNFSSVSINIRILKKIVFIYLFALSLQTYSYIFCVELIFRYSDWLRTGQSGDRIPVEARCFAHVQTGPGAVRWVPSLSRG